MIILSDSTRSDRMSCYGYSKKTTPNIDDFIKDSVLFKNAFTQGVWTLPTHSSLFTGLYPSEHGNLYSTEKLKVQIKSKENTISELLKREGYLTAGLSSNPWVGTLSRMNKGFDIFVESDGTIIDNIGLELKAPLKIKLLNSISKKIDNFLFKLIIPYIVRRPEFTETLIKFAYSIMDYSNKNNKPFFIFINLMDTHQPYYPPLKYLNLLGEKKYFPMMSIINNYRMKKYFDGLEKEKYIKILNDYYNASLRYQDKQLGKLFKYMKDNDYYNDSLIFFTADHGKNLGDFPKSNKMNYLKNNILKIPFIMKSPYGYDSNKKINGFISLIDIYYHILFSIGKYNNSNIMNTINGQSINKAISNAILPYNIKEKDLDRIDNYKVIMDINGKTIIKNDKEIYIDTDDKKLLFYKINNDVYKYNKEYDEIITNKGISVLNEERKISTAIKSLKLK